MVLTSKHLNFWKYQIFPGEFRFCLVDADPVTIKFLGTCKLCLDSVHQVELFVTNFIFSYVTTFADTNLKIIDPPICKIGMESFGKTLYTNVK